MTDELSWTIKASTALLDYAKTVPRFMPEDAWVKVEELVGPAPTPNMKGKLFQAVLISQGHLVKVGHAKSKNPKSKGSEYPVYKSLLCKDESETESVQTRLAALLKDVNLRKISVSLALRKAYEMGVGSL